MLRGLFAVAGIGLALWALPAQAVESPNKGWRDEPSPFAYTGHVQIQPSFIDNRGGHALQGWLQFYIPNEEYGPVVRTAKGSGPNDSRIYSATGTFTDSLNDDAPATVFTYGFDWVPVGSPWPFSLDV